MNRRICISTLDLNYFQYSGVTTKLLIFADAAKELGFSPFFLTPSVPFHRTLRKSLRREFPRYSFQSEFRGYPRYELGAFFPELEFNAHSFHQETLQKILTDVEACFVVSGNNHASLPFYQLGLSYSMWIACPFWDDCKDRIEQAPWSLRKVLDLATKSYSEHLERLLFEASLQIATVTSNSEERVQVVAPTCKNKTKTINIPVDCKQYQPSESAARKNILFIGRLNDPRKNLKLLLDAFSIFAKKNEDHDLVLVGSYDGSVHHELAKHPFTNRIHRHHQISEKDKIYLLQNAFVLAIPSLQEGYGITGVEAMACGIPVISTDCGGINDFVINGQTGRKLISFSPKEMAEAFAELSEKKLVYEQMRINAREFCCSHLSMEAIRPKLRAFIEKHLSK
jgi:glycosyltransferase involved in cell wall biosynthesis